jgi:hypothetical protein
MKLWLVTHSWYSAVVRAPDEGAAVEVCAHGNELMEDGTPFTGWVDMGYDREGLLVEELTLDGGGPAVLMEHVG